MSENTISTSIKEITFDSVVAEFEKEQEVPKEQTPNIGKDFERSNPVLDAPIKKEKIEEKAEETKKEPVVEVKKEEEKIEQKPIIKDIDSVLDRKDDDEEDEKKVKAPDFFSALEALTKEEILLPFDEDKPLSEYSAEDIKELVKANIEYHKKEALDTEINEFFESLPQEIQYAAKYVADGGTDLKSLFKALAATEEVKSLDTKQLKDRELIIREYYRAIDWGTEDEISEEVDRIKELGESELEKLANKYKPKIEKMHDEVTKRHLARQESARKAQEQEMNVYLENAQEAIISGKIGEIQLDKKTQSALWAGLTQPAYQTRRGATTNELGHLIEKYQYVEPNFELMYEVLWLLRDPKGYKEAMGKNLKNEVVSQTVRVLKTEQSKKTATGEQEKTQEKPTVKKKSIQRNMPGFMSGLNK